MKALTENNRMHSRHKGRHRKKRGIRFKLNFDFSFKNRCILLMLPGLIGFITFYIYPFLIAIYYSLINNVFDKQFVGIQNYIDVINNQYFRLAMGNTIVFTGISVGLLIPISFFLAITIMSIPKSLSFIKASFFIPMLLPTASVIIIWQILFGDYSYISSMLHNNTGRLPIYLLFIWKNCGYNMILFAAAFSSVDKSIYEAADLEGISFFRKHISITLPLISPTVFFVFIISLVNSLKIYKEVYLFYGTAYPQQNLYLVQNYMNNHFQKLNYQNLTTGAIIFSTLIYIVVAVGYKLEHKMAEGV